MRVRVRVRGLFAKSFSQSHPISKSSASRPFTTGARAKREPDRPQPHLGRGRPRSSTEDQSEETRRASEASVARSASTPLNPREHAAIMSHESVDLDLELEDRSRVRMRASQFALAFETALAFEIALALEIALAFDLESDPYQRKPWLRPNSFCNQAAALQPPLTCAPALRSVLLPLPREPLGSSWR